MDVIADLVKNIRNVTFEDLPPEAVSASKKSIADTIGVIIAGSSVEGCRLLVEYIKEQAGKNESTIAVFGGKAPACLAAQANGAMARALEIDDVIEIYPLHPSASVVPTCLAIAEREGGISGKEFIAAVALGQDLIIRMALATKVSSIISGRYNLFRVFACAGVAGKLLGLNEEGLSNAMGIAYSQMVGDGQSALDGAMSIYIQQGTIAKSGIESALMARKGITGTRNVLQGPFGFYNAIEPNPNLDALTAELGTTFRGTDISIKPYSSCRCTHEAIDLALRVVREEGINHSRIAKVVVKVNDQSYNLVGQPLDQKRHPKTPVDASFSIPYTVAAAMVRGQVFIDELEDKAIKDEDILALTKKVTPVLDNGLRSDLAVGSTIMEVETVDGLRLSLRTDFPKGNPKNPIGLDEVIEKFRKCVTYSAVRFSDGNVNEMIELLYHLEDLEDVTQVSHLLIPQA